MNSIQAEWKRVLHERLNGNMLMDSPMGQSAFLSGVAFVLNEINEAIEDYDLHDVVNRLRADHEEARVALNAERKALREARAGIIAEANAAITIWDVLRDKHEGSRD
jgi:hypothetical protein